MEKIDINKLKFESIHFNENHGYTIYYLIDFESVPDKITDKHPKADKFTLAVELFDEEWLVQISPTQLNSQGIWDDYAYEDYEDFYENDIEDLIALTQEKINKGINIK